MNTLRIGGFILFLIGAILLISGSNNQIFVTGGFVLIVIGSIMILFEQIKRFYWLAENS